MAVKSALLSFFILLLLMPVAGIVAKELYVWRDKNGVIVYSDKPEHPDAVKIKSMSENKITKMQTEDTSIFDKQTSIKKQLNYGIDIISPTHEETIRDNTGSLHVSARITPTFNPNFKVQLLFNGKRSKTPQSSAVFVMRNVDRGAHTIQVQLLDETGKAVASSEQVTFFMHRASIIGGG